MAEKIYDKTGALVATRDPAKLWKMKTDTDGQPCYVELNEAELSRRAADAVQASIDAARPKPKTVEERLNALETKVGIPVISAPGFPSPGT